MTTSKHFESSMLGRIRANAEDFDPSSLNRFAFLKIPETKVEAPIQSYKVYYGQRDKNEYEEEVEQEPEQELAVSFLRYDSKKKKEHIPHKVKTDVWDVYIGSHIAEHKCICCKRTTIRQRDFQVGHVISEAKGGTLEINNLRPICGTCNRSMGTRNMVDYVKMYGYYI
jgi:5-methylcytosine-specific restriction endonuclease McrA